MFHTAKAGRKLATVVLLSALTACGSSLIAPPETAQGVWTLQQVAGLPLPYKWADATGTYEIQADTLTIAPNGVFTETMVLAVNGSPTVSRYPGTYSAYTDHSLQLVYADGSGYGAVWQGNTLTIQPGTTGAEVYTR